MSRISKILSWAWLVAAALSTAGCGTATDLDFFTLETATGPAGSLVVRGRCDVADGALVLLHAVGGETWGAHRETAILTPVVDRRFVADLGVYERLAYRVEAVLASHLNPSGVLPAAVPRFSDSRLRVHETSEGWEITMETEHRLGTPEDETREVTRHLDRLAAAAEVLAKYTGELRALSAGEPTGYARWFRRYWDDRRQTVLGEPGIDPVFSAVHNRLITADQTLQRRFHAALAEATGDADEAPRLGATAEMLDERLARVVADLSAIRAKLPVKP